MNDAHLHLVFNHLPIIIPIVGLLVMIVGLIIRSEVVKRTAYFIFILCAVCTIPAFFTGEGAEEAVEHLQRMDEKYIHIHEEMAETFALLSYLLGAISIFGLWASLKQKSFSKMITYVAIVFSLVVLFFGKQTGTTGGEVRHTEIRNDSASGAPVQDSDD
ncbi:hypothetical protein [Fluviicola sp.]|uniref:hypothetical protein n=1 Tax=Fluviicola sp. TaxID=1917219 RepID=UPI003D2DFFC3